MAVRVERDGAVAIVTMSRPEAFNAFNTAQMAALRDAVTALSGDSAVRVVVLTGEGKRAFASGADIREMSTLRPTEGHAFGSLGQAVTLAIEAAPQPWIAAINGYALGGGCEIALACDIRIASENAAIGQPEVTLGILPGWGATQRLPRLVGAGLASELILTGRRLTAEEAPRFGLVNAVVPLDELLMEPARLAHPPVEVDAQRVGRQHAARPVGPAGGGPGLRQAPARSGHRSSISTSAHRWSGIHRRTGDAQQRVRLRAVTARRAPLPLPVRGTLRHVRPARPVNGCEMTPGAIGSRTWLDDSRP